MLVKSLRTQKVQNSKLTVENLESEAWAGKIRGLCKTMTTMI